MALETIRKNFEVLVADRQSMVIALTGDWGTGKSHLWDEVRETSSDAAIKKSLSVSLFGVRTITALKMKLLAAAAEGSEHTGTFGKMAAGGAGILSKILRGVHRSAEAIDDIALLALPRVLQNAFVVLDDIERKHAALEIDEILGFIDEFVLKHQTRFLLIVNIDQLKDKALWETFREKAIHHEIALTLTPNEAFDIAQDKAPSSFARALRKANGIVGVSNIRVLVKSISTIEKLLREHGKMDDRVQARFVPAAFLLAVLHLKALPGGPTVDYVLHYGTASASAQIGEDDLVKFEKWRILMEDLGLTRSDRFEHEVVTALRTGLIDYAAIHAVIVDYQSGQLTELIQKRVADFDRDIDWNHHKTLDQLAEEAADICAHVGSMDVMTVSGFHTSLKRISRVEMASELAAAWTRSHMLTPAAASAILGEEKRRQSIPEQIAAYLQTLADSASVSTAEFREALSKVQRKEGDENDVRTLNTATVAQYVDALKTFERDDFHRLIMVHLDWIRQPGHFERFFPHSASMFVEACAQIVEKEVDTRLATILRKTVFKDALADLRKNVRGEPE